MIDNKKIFQWLNPDACWHEWDDAIERQCIHCDAEWAVVDDNPCYDSNDGFFLLLDGLRAKGVNVDMFNDNEPELILEWGSRTVCDMSADIRIALAKATEALIDEGEYQ